MVELPISPSMDELKKFIAQSDLEYATIGFIDYQGTVRGKYVSRSKLESALDGMTFPLISLALDPTDAILFAPGVADPNSGFPDRPVKLLSETARLIPWQKERRNLLILCEFTGEHADYCPRNVYHRVCRRVQSLGYIPCHSIEFEFTLFDETSQSAAQKGYRNLQPATQHKTYYSLLRQEVQSELYNQLMDMCLAMRIPLESIHEEMGDGFMEAALKYGHDVDVADSAVLFRTFAKVVAQRNGKLMSFMARWSNKADGQSGHVHVSLQDKNGKPVFHDLAAQHGISETMRFFIGGMQRLMGDFLLMFAPNINSYKRLVPGIFAPVSAAWGIENRTCSIRAIPGSAKSSRIECRTPGADANPYLSIAAVMAAGIYGVENRIEPTAPTDGNVYQSDVPDALRFPTSFAEAIDRFRQSQEARAFFGDRFVDGYAGTRATQLAQFSAMVTDKELERFFELI